MANAQRQVVRIRLQLVASAGTTDLWLDLSPFLSSIGITRVRGKTILCDKTNNFRFKVGIQTYGLDPEFPDAPIGITTGTGVAYVSTLVRNFVDFDPTVAGNGVINTKPGCRLGVLYSSTDATTSRGDVVVELFVDA